MQFLNFLTLSTFKLPIFKSLKFKSWTIVDFFKNVHNKSRSYSVIGLQEDRSKISILLKYVAKELITGVKICSFFEKSNSLKLYDIN